MPHSGNTSDPISNSENIESGEKTGSEGNTIAAVSQKTNAESLTHLSSSVVALER
jgi:hypothetical protein